MTNNNACLDPGQSPVHSTGRWAPPSSGTLVARYGTAALDQGYVAIPQVVLQYRRALGITPGEWDYLCEIFRYWRSEHDPYPSVETLAAGLACDPSTVRRYRLALEGKGLLRVYRQGTHNRYDLSLLIAAAVRLSQMEQSYPPLPCRPAHENRAVLHAEEEGTEKTYDKDTTPTPRKEHVCSPVPPLVQPIPRGPASEKDSVITALAPLSAEFGDETPASSVTRALNLQQTHGLSRERLLGAIDLAAQRVRQTAPTISIVGSDGTPQGIHYFFGVLKRELRETPRRTRVPKRSHTRPDAVTQAWTNLPPPVAIEETHPIWRAVLHEVQLTITVGNFKTWCVPTRALGHDETVLRVGVPSRFAKEWLEQKLARRITDAFGRVGYGHMQVVYVVQDGVS